MLLFHNLWRMTMIDVNDLNKLDCKKARKDLNKSMNADDITPFQELRKFIEQVESLQRKYTKPIAALLKGPNG